MASVPAKPVTNWRLRQGMLGAFTIQYTCPHCDSKLSSPVKDAGNTDNCPECHRVFVLPIEAGTQAAAIQQEQDAKKLAARQEQQAKKLAAQEAWQETHEAERQHREAQEAASARARERARRESPNADITIFDTLIRVVGALSIIGGFLYIGIMFNKGYGFRFQADNAIGATANAAEALHVNLVGWCHVFGGLALFFYSSVRRMRRRILTSRNDS
jgi:hypothetical protein